MTEELFKEIEQDKQIDPDSLDVDWVEQPNLFYKYSDALNEAIEKRNDYKLAVERAKEDLDQTKARLDLAIREDPDGYGLAKATETAISSAIFTDNEYQKGLSNLFSAKFTLNQCQNEVNKLYTCVNAMQERKAALESLASLLKLQYFSTPNEPRDLSEKYHQKVAKNKKGAKEKVKTRKKRRSSE